MWILESSSELFQGRRMWLKPGKSYLFGRVKKDGVRFAIDNKTISRKHFIIKVEDVRIEDVGNIHARSTIIIEDQNSKAGTHVNGEHIKGTTRELKNEENYIKPGSLPEDLTIRWCPCVLTFNLLKKEVKAGVLKTKQERVRELDIKAVSEYVIGQTTHLLVNKRNTPKSLQALIDGKPLVAESYIDSLEYAATPSDLNEEENLSPLEQDFDSAWPIPHDHLPPPGREPTLRPAEAYKPDPSRNNVFENFTFVFLDQTQYDNLLPPITTAHGKALLYNIITGESTSEELVTFLHNAAGQKGFGDAQRDVDKGGVILVRYKGNAGAEDWTNNLINEASLKLDQRAIDQGEFLDAILANDGMLLRQAVPYENNRVETDVSAAQMNPPLSVVQLAENRPTNGKLPTTRQSGSPASTTLHTTLRSQTSNGHDKATSDQVSEENQQSPEEDEPESQPARKTRFVVPRKGKVFDFDDEFDPDSIVPYENDEQDSVADTSRTPRQQTPMDLGNGLSEAEATPSRKRPRAVLQEASTGFEDDMDDLLPAAAAMKRRKLAREDRNGSPALPTKNKPIPALLKKPKQEKEINVREVAKAQRKAEEDKARKEQDDLDEELRVEPGQPLPVYDVETVVIDLPTGKKQSSEANQAASDHWDPNWNGRKNFKGFRRARGNVNGEVDGDTGGRHYAKVIVPLVDAKTSTYGMGDQYWDKTQEEKEREKRRKASQRATQSQSDQSRVSGQQRSQASHTVHDSDDEEEHDETNGDGVQTSPEVARLQSEAAEIMDHVVDVAEPRRTRASDSQNQTQSMTQNLRGAKRPANGVGRAGAAKKQKTLPVTVVHGSDSDDSDDMKFKFGSRRRGQGKA